MGAGMGMPEAMAMLAPPGMPLMPMPTLEAMAWPIAPPTGLGCTAKMLCPRSRRTCFLLLASSAILRLRAAAVARSHATLNATSLTFLHGPSLLFFYWADHSFRQYRYKAQNNFQGAGGR